MNATSINTSSSPLLPRPVQEHLDRMRDHIRSLRDELDQSHQQENLLVSQVRQIDQDLRLAAQVQRDFLPRRLPEVGKVRFGALFRPAAHVSGDLYDVARLDEEHVGFYIADAVGHGMAAALLTIFLKQAIVTKQITPGGYRLLPPSEVLSKLNAAMLRQELSSSTFATVAYGVINTRTLQLSFAEAGHPRPLLLRGGTTRTLAADGALLGVFPDPRFEDCHVQLHPGDRVVFYSDGVEQIIPPRQSWEELLARHADLGRHELLAELARRTEQASLDPRERDDLTVIVAEAIA